NSIAADLCSAMSKTFSPLPDNQKTLGHSVHDISATDNTNQLTLGHDGDALDFALGKQGRDLVDGHLFINRDDLTTHNVGNTQPFAIDLTDNVGFSDDTNDVAMPINYGQSANTLQRK